MASFVLMLLAGLAQLLCFLSPLASMLWRGVVFKVLNMVRASIRAVKFLLMAAFASSQPTEEKPKKNKNKKGSDDEDEEDDGEAAPLPPLKRKVPRRLVPLFRAMDAVDTACIRGRGWMQCLAGPVRLSPLHAGATDTAVHYIETEYHMLFAVVFLVTTYVSSKALEANARAFGYLVRLFQLSDIAKQLIWGYFFFTQYVSAMRIGVGDGGFADDLSAVAARQRLLQKSACGVVIACMDAYVSIVGMDRVHPLSISGIQLVSAAYYIFITFD